MIILINGPLGSGKTTVARAVLYRLERGVMLDGDAAGEIHPFEIHNAGRVQHLYSTLAMLVAWHQQEAGYQHFVINYVFERPRTLTRLLTSLRPLDPDIHIFRLRASADTLQERIRQRGCNKNAKELAWELQRGPELLRIQDANGPGDSLGIVIETDDLSPEQVADAILQQIAGTGAS